MEYAIRGGTELHFVHFCLLLCTLSLCILLLLLLLTTVYSVETDSSHAWPVSFGSAPGCGGEMFHADLVPLLCTPAFRVRNATLHTCKILGHSNSGVILLHTEYI